MHTATPSATAFHEAGHAIVAALLGRPYGCGLNDRGGGMAAPDAVDVTRPVNPADYSPDKLATAYARDPIGESFDDGTISAAGYTAAALAAGAPVTVLTGPDRVLCEAAGAKVTNGDYTAAQHWIGLCTCRARALLSERWPAVERVAQALEGRRRLSSAEVAALTT